MSIFKHKKEGNVRKTYFLGIPVASRIRVVYARGGGFEYVRYVYKLFGFIIKRTHSISEAVNIGGQEDLLARVKRIEAMVEIDWLSRIEDCKFIGQLGQDAIAYAIFKGKKQGFYANIGANDGKEIDNTLLFENLGWQGFCVEANPKTFEKLKQNRKCDCYNVALVSKPMGKMRMATSDIGGQETSAIMEFDTGVMEYAWAGKEIEYFEVDTSTFDDIMRHYPQISHIDFMSLDVEGAELEVLKGIDFERFSFGLMSIEHNNVAPARVAIIEFLKSKGYRLFMDNYWDFMFVKDEKIGWQIDGWWR